MEPEHIQSRLERFASICREHGLSVTVQRRMILQAVLERADHPTADQVYELVKNRLPGLSRTTVYRVLETLVSYGVITKVCHPGAAVRFDPKVHRHHHLVCAHCHGIADYEDERLNELELPRIRPKGFEIQDFYIHFRGVCAACREKSEKVSKVKKTTPRTPGAKRQQATGKTRKVKSKAVKGVKSKSVKSRKSKPAKSRRNRL